MKGAVWSYLKTLLQEAALTAQQIIPLLKVLVSPTRSFLSPREVRGYGNGMCGCVMARDCYQGAKSQGKPPKNKAFLIFVYILLLHYQMNINCNLKIGGYF